MLFDKKIEKLLRLLIIMIFKQLCGKKFIFKIKFSDFSLKDGLQDYTVLKISTSNLKLKNKFRFKHLPKISRERKISFLVNNN